MKLKPWREKMWCIPTVTAEYVVRMEDVLDLYAETPDPRRPVVCFDETPPATDRGSAGPEFRPSLGSQNATNRKTFAVPWRMYS